MRSSNDQIVKNLAPTLSTRQLLRIAQRMSVYSPDTMTAANHAINSPYTTIQRTFLAKFLPSLPRAALENAIGNVDITPVPAGERMGTIKVSTTDGRLTIGNTSADLYKTDAVTKVPDIQFFDVPQHLRLLEHLLQVKDNGNF